MNEEWKCSHHKENYRHLLHLNANTNTHRICLECKIQNKISDSEILSILELIESDKTEFFLAYPVLEDY